MENIEIINKDQFEKRIKTLCSRRGLSGFPKDKTDQQILLKSAVLDLDKNNSYSESEINVKLKDWIAEVSIQAFDHNSLRRYLIDFGYLIRKNDGSAYQRAAENNLPYKFETSIDEIRLTEIIEEGRQEIEKRKQEYMRKQKKS